jgi:23S rRNA pseudouridine1911/1915/1917 synthase
MEAEICVLASKMPNTDTNSFHLIDNQHTFSISANEAGQRLDRYLVSALNNLSRSGTQQLVEEGHVLVNGRSSKSGYALREGDEVQVSQVSRPLSSNLQPQELPLDVVYEDTDLLVINKAAGMVIHPAPGHADDTLVNALLARYPVLQAESGDDLRPGIVHRLDKDTSGLLLVAKNAHTQAALIEQMKEHQITKRYLALVEGNVSLDQGSIDAPIGRDPRHRQQMTVTAVGSREARTHFKVLQRFKRHTLLLLQLETGRTHQIRVHLKAIGHPVVGDPTYGASHGQGKSALDRQFLHAYQLKLTHPATGVLLELEAPLPPDLQDVLDKEEEISL